MVKEPLDDSNLEEDVAENKNIMKQSFLNNDLFLLIIILLIFYGNLDDFTKQFKFINSHIKKFKKYLNIADATLQALDQATQIPKQMFD